MGLDEQRTDIEKFKEGEAGGKSMKALLDTNIIIHREASKIVNRDIGTLFKWLDKGKYIKCIHPITIEEIEKNVNKDTINTFSIKLNSYERLKTVAPLNNKVKAVSDLNDVSDNDINDTTLLNEVYCERVDFFITEDKKIHKKAELLGIIKDIKSAPRGFQRVALDQFNLIVKETITDESLIVD